MQSVVQNYLNNFPNHCVIGGFSTGNELFHNLFYLHYTINEICSPKTNRTLLLLDPFFSGKNIDIRQMIRVI